MSSEDGASVGSEAEWWALAKADPVQAMRHPFFDLLTLADPQRWIQLSEENAAKWCQDALIHLLPCERQLLAADCIEQLLPAFESVFRGHGVRDDIELRRKWARGEITEDGWRESMDLRIAGASFVAADLAPRCSLLPPNPHISDQMEHYAAAGRAALCSALNDPDSVIYWATSPFRGNVRDIWVWDRMVYYLRGRK